jgi:methyl-accepting chemotaxis protein
MQSLRKFNIAIFFIIALLLAALVVTGIRKHNLAFDYSAIVQESESTIFLYTTIQDQATEALLSRSFIRDLDLGRVVVGLRTLAEKPANDELTLQTMAQVRHINKQFLQFDRIVINEMRSRVMEYQKIALIIMGAIVSLACFSLIVLYLKSVKPLTTLSFQIDKALQHDLPINIDNASASSVEVRSIINGINHLIQRNTPEGYDPQTLARRENEISTLINEAVNRVNGIINYTQVLMDSIASNTNEINQQELLSKIVHTGEQCAVTLRKIIK